MMMEAAKLYSDQNLSEALVDSSSHQLDHTARSTAIAIKIRAQIILTYRFAGSLLGPATAIQ